MIETLYLARSLNPLSLFLSHTHTQPNTRFRQELLATFAIFDRDGRFQTDTDFLRTYHVCMHDCKCCLDATMCVWAAGRLAARNCWTCSWLAAPWASTQNLSLSLFSRSYITLPETFGLLSRYVCVFMILMIMFESPCTSWVTGTLILCGKLDRRTRMETVWYPSTSSWMCVALPLVKRPAPSEKIDWRPVPSFSLRRGVRITHMPCTSSGSDKTPVPILFPPFPETKHGTWYTSPDTSKHQQALWTQTR